MIAKYEIKLVTLEGNESILPGFIKTSAPNEPKLWFETKDTGYIDKYRIRCKASLLRKGEVIDTVS